MHWDIDEYQKAAQRTSATSTERDKLLNGCLGLAGEGGEVCDLVKKYAFQGHPLEREKLVKELGDVLWYCAEVATGLGVDLSEVAQRNYEKLLRRYPDGFEAARSLDRSAEAAEEQEGQEVHTGHETRDRGVHGLRRGRTHRAGSPKDSLKQRP